VILKGGEGTHLKETPWKERSKSHEQANKGGCTKPRKTGCLPGLLAQFSLTAGFSQLLFCLPKSLPSGKQLNV